MPGYKNTRNNSVAHNPFLQNVKAKYLGEKTEKLVCRSGWLRLSAARTRSDWSKTFPGQFFENGRVEEEEEEGPPTKSKNRGQFRARQNLRATDTFSQNCADPDYPPQPQRVFFVRVLMSIFCGRVFAAESTDSTPLFMDLFPKSKSRNDEAQKYISLNPLK